MAKKKPNVDFPKVGDSYRVLPKDRDFDFYPCFPYPGSRIALTQLTRGDVVKCETFEDILGVQCVVLILDGAKVMVAKDICEEILVHVNRK